MQLITLILCGLNGTVFEPLCGGGGDIGYLNKLNYRVLFVVSANPIKCIGHSSFESISQQRNFLFLLL